MPEGGDPELAELRKRDIADPVVADVLRQAWAWLDDSELAADIGCDLLVGDARTASPALAASRFHTTSCKALLHDRLIVVDEGFLIEAEAAVRAFATTGRLSDSPYLRSDADLFALIGEFAAAPHSMAARFRRATRRDPAAEAAIRESLAYTYLFFIAHELGHLRYGNDARSFAQFVDPDAPLEQRVANAVVKLRRHAEEFRAYGFTLRGFEVALTPGEEVEASSAAMRRQLADLDLNHGRWFADEAAADDFAVALLVERLQAAARRSDAAADRAMALMVRGIFAVALCAWHRDLLRMLRLMGLDWPIDAAALSLRMAMDRTGYIHAAAVFGEVHRFTLLRAERVIEAAIRARSDVFERGSVDAARLAAASTESLTERDRLLHDALSRYCLVCILMDTAVKLAYHGSATAWLLDKDAERGSAQPFVMSYYSIQAEMERLRRMGYG